MAAYYISRTLLANKGSPGERLVTEEEIATFQVPLVILGDPGLGKTKLTESLEETLGAPRVTGGTFYRCEDPTRFTVVHGKPLIIDGLDEITSSSGGSAVDEVLKKLSRIGNPKFILSCRAADWQGSMDRYKIATDYGVEPITLLLQPFSYEDAIRFLSAFDDVIDAESILDELAKRDLGDLYGNPLTLRLIAELAKDGQGLPESRADLFHRACEVLVREENRAHQSSLTAQSGLDNLLDSAGAIFAHLLLSGSLGVADRHRDGVPDGYISKGELENISNAPLILAVLKTRLFQSTGENLFIPFHRVIAEFLGARWLCKRLSNGLSERRVLQSLTFADGVPTALRGLHAWLAHFNTAVADRCIQTDPYGVLRYGEPNQLPVNRARLLLNSLASLANEDPYFRSEDWGRRAVAGLARPELKDQIVDLIKHPDRHFQLSTLILEALPGSSLTDEIVPELMTLVHDANAAYVERINAAEALIKSNTRIDWVATVQSLTNKAGSGNRRLALEIIAHVRGTGFAGEQVADVLLDYQKVLPPNRAKRDDEEEDDDDDRYVSGIDYMLVKGLSPAQCAQVLDGIAARIAANEKPRHWRAENNLSTTVHRLVVKAIEDTSIRDAARLWSWLKFLEGTKSYSSEDREHIRDFFRENSILRREVQKLAFGDNQIDGAPWMAIAYDLPAVSAGLALTIEDTIDFLTGIALKVTLSNFDIELWASLIRSKQSSDGLVDEIQKAAKLGIERHAELQRQWEDLTAPPKRDWRKEQEERQAREQEKRLRRFGKHRANFLPDQNKIESGSHFGALNHMANAYLNRCTDLNHDAAPVERLQEWLGDELTNAALSGFVAFLSRDDLPTAKKIADLHSEGKRYNAEPIMTCGILEMVRTRRPLNGLPKSVTEAVLASWWEFPSFNSNRYGDEPEKQLEQIVFSSDETVEEFLTTVMEPRIRAKQTHVPGLYRLPRDERFRRVAGKLALRWLRAYPDALPSTQWELLETAIQLARSDDVTALVRERLLELLGMEAEIRRMWMSAAFLMDFDANREGISAFSGEDRNNLWSLRNVIRPDRSKQWKPISLQQLEFVITKFAVAWRPEPYPSSGWSGDTNPRDAAEFIRSCINAIGADHSEEASIILDRLVDDPNAIAYIDQVKHVRAQQRRLRRDKEFRVPSFGEIKRTLAGGLPGNIDDLKALTLDRLETVQDYLRKGDTRGWEAFWNGATPKSENTCRDRLLDALRPRVPPEINFLPETLMPEANRADIVAIYHADGIPIEIKGQWHSEVWDAANVQLIEKYARDWRAHGRGIYLVLWFGNVPRKNLPKHPDSLPAPSSPSQLREMLVDRLTEAERSRIDVFVLDLSKP